MSIQQNEIKILDQLLLVDLSGIHLWTARKKLKPEMLEGKIPPAILASLGSMRVIDPEKLNRLRRSSGRLQRWWKSVVCGFWVATRFPRTRSRRLLTDWNRSNRNSTT
nr:DUF3150 domain-containing protein [Pseudomonas aeruginosa]